MPIYWRALLVCDRCDAELHMDDVETLSDVERRLRDSESEWAEDENQNMVCGDCWVKWDAEHTDVATDSTTQRQAVLPSNPK